jgi:hypothetical protein
VTLARFKTLLAEYGPVALWTYFGLFALVLSGFAIAIAAGVQVESASGGAGVLGAAWLATKLTQPLRIGATLLLTPLMARVATRFRRSKAVPEVAERDRAADQA